MRDTWHCLPLWAVLIDGPKLNIDYNDILYIVVRNHENYCMIQRIQLCPEKEVFLGEIIHSVEEYDLFPNSVTYK